MGTLNLPVNSGKLSTPWLSGFATRRKQHSLGILEKPLAEDGSTVGGILRKLNPRISKAVLVGRSGDGLPVMMELSDPEIGAVLIGCESGCGKTHQLQVMIDSAMKTNAPHELQVFILTLNPAEWDWLKQHSSNKNVVYGIHAWYDPRAEEMIQSLTELAESRREVRLNGPAVLVILDDLNFVEDLSLEAQVNLNWLLAYGAQSDVWCVSTINAALVPRYRYWVDTFRTRVLGKVNAPEIAEILAMRPAQHVSRSQPGEFNVWTGLKWMSYRLPLLGG
jgi:hypothetical protein